MTIAALPVPGASPSGTARTSLFDEALLNRLHEMISSPQDTAVWWTGVSRRVEELDVAFWDHRSRMESQAGLLRDVVEAEPRLVFRARACERELESLADDLARLRRVVSDSMGRADGVSTAVGAANAVCAAVRAHHRHLRRLVHEAYVVDLGAAG